jgi:hypothetical protein
MGKQPAKGRKSIIFSLTLPPEVYGLIEEISDRTGMSRSEVGRALIVRSLYDQMDRKVTIDEVLGELHTSLRSMREERRNQRKKPSRLGKKGML